MSSSEIDISNLSPKPVISPRKLFQKAATTAYGQLGSSSFDSYCNNTCLIYKKY